MSTTSEGVQNLLYGVGGLELAVSAGVCWRLGRRWVAQRSPATARAFGVFFVLALVIAVGYVAPEDVSHGWGAWFTKALICVLVLMPFLAVELAWVLGGLRDAWRRVAQGLLAAQVLATLTFPPLPAAGEPRSASATVLVLLIVGSWGLQSAVAGWGLWQLGRGESSLVRHRMRALSTGTVLLGLTLVLSGAAGAAQAGATQVVLSLLGLIAVGVSALAFLAPPAVRLLWRQGDLTALAVAERGLMQALTPEHVATTIVPTLARVFGGRGAALVAADGRVRWASGVVSDVSAERLANVEADDNLLLAPLKDGALVVVLGDLSPVFGLEERDVLSRVATMVDLALERVALFGKERAGREAVEAANDELETLLYSVSHDLRSPLISVLGYLDFLRAEHGEELTGDGAHYLERISVNALYMQSLISDLLELSRIGRLDPPPEGPLDLAPLAQEVLDGAQLSHPDARLEIRGGLPLLVVNDVRVRQLLTNLVDNALRHGDREDLTVAVSATRTSAGGVTLQVADNGRGIPEEYRARVVKVFERLDAPKSSPGTGIGLAICKRIAETLGGTLTVLGPTPPNSTGTTIEISLPGSLVAVDRPSSLLRAPQLQEELT